MAGNTKISAMNAATALTGSEVVAGVQSAANVKISPAQIKTFAAASTITTVFASVTATGATQLGAKAISASFPMTFVIQASTASTKGVRLPAAATGRTIKVANVGAFGVKVYPSTNGKIGGATTNAADTTVLAVNKMNTYIARNTTYWVVDRGA